MTVSSGFFNSVSGDRTYNAKQFGEFFDGLICDGVYTNVGDKLKVRPGTGMQVIVGTGRGWFMNTWILNDADILISINAADPQLKRIDAIVIDVNTGTSARENSIIKLTGTPHVTDPQKPTLVNESTHKQYPLAWIKVEPGITQILASDIVDCALSKDSQGNPELPKVEALLEYSSLTKAEIDARFNRDENPAFNEAATLANINSTESIFTIFGKIKKLFSTILNKLPVIYGGTGQNTFTTNAVLLGNGTNALKAKGSVSGAFYSTGSGAEPQFGALPVAQGGTGATNAAQALTNLGVPSDVAKAMSKDVYCSQDSNRSMIDVAHGGTGSNNGTINGVRLMKSGNSMGYYDANGNFKTFRQPTGNAGAAQVLKNYTFANASSDALTGTMENYSGNSRRTVTPSGGTGNEQLSLAPGYHDSVIVNRTNPYNAGVTATKKGDALAVNVLRGKYFTSLSAGVNVQGTMNNYSGTSRQTVAVSYGTGNEQLSLPPGYHDSVIVNRTRAVDYGKDVQKAVTWDKHTILHHGDVIDICNVVAIKVLDSSTFVIGGGMYEYLQFKDGYGGNVTGTSGQLHNLVNQNLTIPANSRVIQVVQNGLTNSTDWSDVAKLHFQIYYACDKFR